MNQSLTQIERRTAPPIRQGDSRDWPVALVSMPFMNAGSPEYLKIESKKDNLSPESRAHGKSALAGDGKAGGLPASSGNHFTLRTHASVAQPGCRVGLTTFAVVIDYLNQGGIK